MVFFSGFATHPFVVKILSSVAVENNPFIRQRLPVQELIVLSCERRHWFKTQRGEDLAYFFEAVDRKSQEYIDALSAVYPRETMRGAMERAEQDMRLILPHLEGIDRVVPWINRVACSTLQEVISSNNSLKQVHAGERALTQLVYDCLYAMAWEKVRKGRRDLPNPFLHLLELRDLGVAKVSTDRRFGGKVTTSFLVVRKGVGPSLVTRVQGSEIDFCFQDWHEVFPSEEDREISREINRFAEQVSVSPR